MRLLLASATPCAHFAYGVHMVCFIPLASVMRSTTLLIKCVPPSEWMRSGSGKIGRYCSNSTLTTVSASAFFVGWSTVVSEKSQLMASIYLQPFAASGNCIKSICMYSNGLVAITMYHMGRGIVFPHLVFKQDKHRRQSALMNSISTVFPISCMA